MSFGHDARCERTYTDSGVIFTECLCSLRAAQAKAWDEGYVAGAEDESDACWSPGTYSGDRANPYREDRP